MTSLDSFAICNVQGKPGELHKVKPIPAAPMHPSHLA